MISWKRTLRTGCEILNERFLILNESKIQHSTSIIDRLPAPVPLILLILQLTRFRSPYGLLPAVFLRYTPILSKNALCTENPMHSRG
jgi:hypothetical protein